MNTTITLVCIPPHDSCLRTDTSDITTVTRVTSPSVGYVDLQLASINANQSVYWAMSPVLNMIIVVLHNLRVMVVVVVMTL